MKFPTSWRVEASLRGIKDCRVDLGVRTAGLALQDNVVWSKTFSGSESIPGYLTPFFDSVWAPSGLNRRMEAQVQLARDFGG